MSCASCANSNGAPAGCKNNGFCSNDGCNKLTTFNWLSNLSFPPNTVQYSNVEIRFKNERKSFFKNENKLSLLEGDVVVVEAKNGIDVGVVCLQGELVRMQMQKKNLMMQAEDLLSVKRKATQKDIDLWQNGRAKEAKAILNSRNLANSLGLQMKISDVEYQADQTKATFYYTAEERVDFRELVKKLAETFKVRIEMKQIGTRQEAGKLGGIGSCGRELCCSTWLTDFRSVSTSAARYQQLSLNPSKLAGQCGKLKCCLNYELDAYVDELKLFPDTKKKLKTEKGNAFFQKMDIFSHRLWYSYQDQPSEFIELSIDRVKEILDSNNSGEKVSSLLDERTLQLVERVPKYENVVGQDSLTRFDKQNKNRKGRKNKRRNHQNRKSNDSSKK